MIRCGILLKMTEWLLGEPDWHHLQRLFRYASERDYGPS